MMNLIKRFCAKNQLNYTSTRKYKRYYVRKNVSILGVGIYDSFDQGIFNFFLQKILIYNSGHLSVHKVHPKTRLGISAWDPRYCVNMREFTIELIFDLFNSS